eukprot:gene56740-77765_t
MHRGTFVETGSASDVFHHPRHAYTRSLIAAEPRIDRQRRYGRASPEAGSDGHAQSRPAATCPSRAISALASGGSDACAGRCVVIGNRSTGSGGSPPNRSNGKVSGSTMEVKTFFDAIDA